MIESIARAAILATYSLIKEYRVSKANKFDLLEGEIEIKRGAATLIRGGESSTIGTDIILCLTNKRLRFQYGAKYLSYPLSAIVSVKLSQKRLASKILATAFELELSDGRKEFLCVPQIDDWIIKILEAKNSLGGADAIEKAQDGTVLDEDKTTLRRNLTNCFNESELRTLCFDLDIDYESIPGSTKEEKARELIVYCERHGLLIRLLKICQQQRSYVKWI